MSQTFDQPTTLETRFVGLLYDLAERGDRGELARIRRVGAHPAALLGPLGALLPADMGAERESLFLGVAALFARSSKNAYRGDRLTLARAMRLHDPERADRSDGRMAALLLSDPADVLDHVSRIVPQLSDPSELDWAQLLHDLAAWGRPTRTVQRRWARDYVRSSAPQPEEGKS